MTSYPGPPVTLDDALTAGCPRCGQGKGCPCLYMQDSYMPWPDNKTIKHREGETMLATVHSDRREVVRQRRIRESRAELVTPASPGARGAAAAMRAWDVEEFRRMREWLAEFGYLLTEADLEHRPVPREHSHRCQDETARIEQIDAGAQPPRALDGTRYLATRG